MKPILIHVHAFYIEMLPEIRRILASFREYPHEIWVTYVEGNDEMPRALEDFEHVLPVPNRGFDVGPFVRVLNAVDLSQYSYIAKLHTKRNIMQQTFVKKVLVSGARWRNYLFSYAEPQNLPRCIAAFETTPTLGMVGHHVLIHDAEPATPEAWEWSRQMLASCGLQEKNSRYICGTMFMCRAELMLPVRNLLADEEFEIPDRELKFSISHAVERFLGMVITAQGYDIRDVYTPESERRALHLQNLFYYICHRIWRFIYLRKENKNGGCIIKLLKIPVYYKKGRKN